MLLRWQLDLAEEEEEEGQIDRSLWLHHSMADTPRAGNTINLLKLVQEHRQDPAVKVRMFSMLCAYRKSDDVYGRQSNFMHSLKNHLLLRLLGLDYNGDKRTFSLEQRSAIHLTNLHSVVESKILCINYTTYDIRQDHDTIQPSQGDVIMTSSRDQDHPFWYAQIIRAWHIQAYFSPAGASSSKHKMEVLLYPIRSTKSTPAVQSTSDPCRNQLRHVLAQDSLPDLRTCIRLPSRHPSF